MPLSTPIPLAIGRFKRLPQRSAEVWQGSIRKLPAWVDDPDDAGHPPYRPVAAFWVSLRTGLIHIDSADGREAMPAGLALSSFLEFGLKWAKQLEGRPARVEVSDPRLRDVLVEPLAALNTPVVLVEDMPRVDEAFREVETEALGGQRLPGALDARGVTVDRLRAFADAAALFFRARPWDHLINEDLIAIETPKPPRGLALISVLGNGGQEFGISFFGSRRAFDRMILPDPGWTMPKEVHGVTFGPIDDLPFGDVDAWEDHALPVAGPLAYALASRMRSDGTMTRPNAAELNHIEALLRALAVTTEDELDRGRWEHRVDTFDGPVAVTLALPLLLEAERGDRSRVPRPDVMPRVVERVSAQIARFMEGRQLASLDDANAALDEALKDGVFDARLQTAGGRALTPLEQAQDLAYEAMEATGRLRIKLARKAIAMSPDCADAWIVLGDAATNPDVKLAHYRSAIDAGARAIGDEFEALAGEFWGHPHTRPYMRARLALAQMSLDLGQVEETEAHYRELLRLNHGDNQGVRYLLLPLLLEEGKDEEAGALLDQFDGDIQAVWLYARALWLFRREGNTAPARAALAEAMHANPHVTEYLLDPESMPFGRPPYVALGSEDEGVIAADTLLTAFSETPGVEAWLRQHAHGSQPSGRRGRGPVSGRRTRRR